MHKARENNDGTFSIGKTWMLDDLSSIQSFSAYTPTSPMEQQYKQWASNVGFLVNVGKPYYWHARTSKEKEFFIGSLVKIYRKYTGGKVPELIGFDDRERQLLVGAPPSGPPSMGPPGANSRGPSQGPARPEVTIPPPRPVSPQGGRSQSPYSSRAQSRDGPRCLPSEEQSLRAQRSREQMTRPSTGNSGRSGPSPFAPPHHQPPPFPVDQRTQPPPRSADRMAPENRMPKAPMHLPPEPTRSKDIPGSLLAAAAPTGPRERPSGEFEESKSVASQPNSRPQSSRGQVPLPEPRPILRSQESSSSSPDPGRNKDNVRPTTPKTPSAESQKATQSPGNNGGRPEGPLRLPLLETSPEPRDKDGTEKPLDLPPTAMVAAAAAVPPALKPASSGASNAPVMADPADATTSDSAKDAESSERAPENAPTSPPLSPAEPSPEGEGALDAHRPGLGPMIKKKQSKDVVGAFRKPATTQTAFKPRPGGAGERLMAAAKRQKAEISEPDGITGVVPAPFLRTNQDTENAASPEMPEKETSIPAPSIPSPTTSPAKEPPTVEVTQSVADEAPAVPVLEIPEEPRDTSRANVKVDVDERARSVSPSPHDRRRRRHEDNTIKYCQALGIDAGVLEGRGVDFDDILTDLGWNGRLNDEKKIEDLEADIRREIGRVEATSWLGNLEQQEGKVDQLARLIERTVEECEELDNLLTLYSHELNVSIPSNSPTLCPVFMGVSVSYIFSSRSRLFTTMCPT